MKNSLAVALLLFACFACGDASSNGAKESSAEREADLTEISRSITPATTSGAVASVAGRPILREEMETLADAAQLAAPEYTRAHDRRLALEMELIPRAALAAAHPSARATAKTEAEEAIARLEKEPNAGRELGMRLEKADVRQLGLPLWYALQNSPPGKWVGPLEDLGRWRLGRWISMSEAPSPGQGTFDCELLDFWFLPEENPLPYVNAALAQARLEIHDAAVDDLITERMRWRMKRH